MTTAEALPESDEFVGVPISGELARLALIAADGFKRLSGPEMMKLEAMMRADITQKTPTARSVTKLCQLVGFMFAMDLNAARDKRLQEKAHADGSTGG